MASKTSMPPADYTEKKQRRPNREYLQRIGRAVGYAKRFRRLPSFQCTAGIVWRALDAPHDLTGEFVRVDKVIPW